MAFAKAVVAIAGAGLVALQQALEDDAFSQAEWIAVGIALLTAVGVFAVPNKPPPAPPA